MVDKHWIDDTPFGKLIDRVADSKTLGLYKEPKKIEIKKVEILKKYKKRAQKNG